MIKTFFIAQFTFFCLFGAVFGFTLNKVRTQTENTIMAQIPEEAYHDLPINLLLKIPVVK